MIDINTLKYDAQGLIPTIVQDAHSSKVLMVAYMNKESLAKTLETKETWFFSRSRQELWHKGGTSGNVQKVESIAYDCDKDTLLVKVLPAGPACHTGATTCFYRDLLSDDEAPVSTDESVTVLADLAQEIKHTLEIRPEKSYTTYLVDTGIDKIAKKIGEESSEVIIAAKNGNPEEIISESADLLYHLAVLWEERGVELSQVMAELNRRSHKKGNKKEVGHQDKTF